MVQIGTNDWRKRCTPIGTQHPTYQIEGCLSKLNQLGERESEKILTLFIRSCAQWMEVRWE